VGAGAEEVAGLDGEVVVDLGGEVVTDPDGAVADLAAEGDGPEVGEQVDHGKSR